ncbi:MAG: CBS domain-containing protein [Gaiellaceae bacterium]
MDTTPTTISAPAFSSDRVADVMSPGVLSCPPETPLRTAARMMATYQVHAIFVFASRDDASPFWTVLTDLDLIEASLPDIENRTAGGTAHEHVVTIESDAPIARAAQLMSQHRITHLVVVSPETTRPLGVVSSLDLARAIAADTTPYDNSYAG